MIISLVYRMTPISSDANKILRYWEYLWGVQHHKHGKVATYDGNTAIRMSAYAAIDGFSEDDSTLEMHRLRSRLLVARGYSYQEENGNVHYIDSIRLKTDARRVYQALASHIPPDYAWTDMPFLTGEDPVRLMNTVTLANRAIASAWLHEVLERTENLHLNKLDSVTRRRLQKEGRKITGLPLAS